MTKFKALPYSGHLIVMPPAKRGEPETRHSLFADENGIIETDDEHEIAQLRQGGVCEELVIEEKKATADKEPADKEAVVKPEPADKETVEDAEPEVKKAAVKDTAARRRSRSRKKTEGPETEAKDAGGDEATEE